MTLAKLAMALRFLRSVFFDYGYCLTAKRSFVSREEAARHALWIRQWASEVHR